ncbi:DUF3006 domain-containing protein [Candidatus Parcubacteria bacterium]|nr:MAG: DUF3006 domain-containing protein [Candidatus Parcubacteria bacterium]
MTIDSVIDRIEGDRAVLKTPDGLEIIWPASKLPADAKEGTVIKIAITDDTAKESADKELAKNILSEILNNSNEA